MQQDSDEVRDGLAVVDPAKRRQLFATQRNDDLLALAPEDHATVFDSLDRDMINAGTDLETKLLAFRHRFAVDDGKTSGAIERNAGDKESARGNAPWAVPPGATFPVGFQLIGQNGVLVTGSTPNEDLFLTTIVDADSSAGLLVSSATGGGDAFSAGLLFLGARGRAFSSAANEGDATRIDIEMRAKNFFIAFQ